MSLIISRVFTYDTDAGNYIQAVEAADGQALEPATRQAINNFVIGCKRDGIWNAIKASCILAGARTLAGALVPLAGAAPTNFNFVGANYNRKTGLVGNGSSKYLNSSRAENADPQNSFHVSAFISEAFSPSKNIILGTDNSAGSGLFVRSTGLIGSASRSSVYFGNAVFGSGFAGVARYSATSSTFRAFNTTVNSSTASATPNSTNYFIFSANPGPSAAGDGRLAFYSIGESLDLALLDGRVTDLINTFSVVIP